MKKYYLLALLLVTIVNISAQEDMKYLVSDSVLDKYNEAMQDPNIFKPRHLDISEDEALKMADRYRRLLFTEIHTSLQESL